MKKMKKILAFVLAMAMVLGMSATAFAAEWTSEGKTGGKVTDGVSAPAPKDTATATVSNIIGTATVTAYRIYEPNYLYEGEGTEKVSLGFSGYKAVDALTGEGQPLNNVKAEDINADIIAAIANMGETDLKDSLDYVTMTSANNTSTELQNFTASLGAGYWMVLVSGNVDKKIYNPMLIGVSYVDENGKTVLSSDDLDAKGKWDLDATDGYAKSSEPEVNKNIVTLANPDAEYDPTNNTSSDPQNHNNVTIGSKVDFMIDFTIPSYSKDYEEVEVSIKDQLSKGLTLDTGSIKVWVNNELVNPKADDTFTLDKVTAEGFTINFVSSYVLANGNASVVVAYKATVGEDAGLNFDANTNKVEFEYTNDPTNSENKKKTEDKTYTYTFALDANLFGESNSEWNKVTEEILKTGEKHTIKNEHGEDVDTFRLGGATFTLTKSDGTSVEATSDEMGRLNFKGLTEGEYTLKETKAPEGYSLNTTELPVIIAADYNDDGTLNYYTVTVNGRESKYTAEYVDGEVTNIKAGATSSVENETITTGVSNTTGFVNTKLSALPSTGGIGTTIFTIGGCLIMIVAAGLFFASRRKASK